ncbi:DUF2285 domain-containing protein [Brucella oryzae]|uniref:DUF2285 domain-containing protein n=2 Tax=Alphaproteobacteria TaxID=28211 RepID=A0A2S7J4X2_9HYPH|nr:Uncharacterized protein SGRAN_1873 [Sphingopyxis granuli]PQA75308.1 DUF2285 domain-containing protein [Brucella oryzae]
MCWRRSHGAGGCDFPSDPETSADEQALFWSPGVRPQAVKLLPVEHHDGDTEPIVTLAHLDGLDLRHAADGWHGIWQVDGVTHQFWLPDAVPDAPAFYASILPMDDFHDLRAHASQRLRRSFRGDRPGRDFRAMPTQLRQLHILALRALDAKLHGESYRAIAEVLLGFEGTKEDWEVDSRKNKVRRLVANGIAMMRGGYRLLLHYPIKSPRK